MDDNLQQHYAELQRLTDSVKKGWWSGTEKTDSLNFLENSVAHDPNLAHLVDPQSPGFLDDLSLTLRVLLLNNSEVPANNQPPQNVTNDPKKSQFLKKLESIQQKIPVAFRDAKGKPAGFSQEETYLSLKKYGVIDDQGNFNLNNTVAKQRAEREITKNFVRQYHRQSLENELELSLVTEAPVGLFQSEFFGKGQIPGVVQTIAASLSEKTSEYLLAIMEGRLGGAIDMNAPNFQTALDKAIVEVRSANRFGSLLSKTEIQGVITAYLRGSPSFNRLAPNQQDILIQGAAAAILNGAKRTETPRAVHKPEIVQNPSGEISLKITSASYQTSRRGITNFQALPTLPKNIGEKIVQEVGQVVKSDFNSGTNIVATKKLQDFWEGLAADPTSAILHYPVNSLLHLLPRPLQNWYFKQTGTQDAWKELQKKYFYATSPEGLRLFTQDMVYRGAKAALRPLGITNDKGQWVWASTLGWMAEKTTTGVGEGLASLTSHIPLVGNFLSKTFKRRLGKKRNRDEELAAGVMGIFLDIGMGVLKILPKLAWRLINQIPAVKQFKAFVTQKYFALESRFGLFRTLRIAGGVTSSYIRGVFSLNTLAGAGWGNIIGTALGFGPAGTLLGAAGGAIYQAWFNIAKNGDLIKLLKLPNVQLIFHQVKGHPMGFTQTRVGGIERVFKALGRPGVFMAEHGWARLPIKGSFVSYLLWQAGVPGLIAAIPTVAEWVWETKGWWGEKFAHLGTRAAGGLASRFPLLGRIGDFFSGLASRFGFLGRFFNSLGGLVGKIFFAIPYIPLVAELLGGTPLLVALGHWLPTAWGFWGVAQILIELSGGWGALLAGATAGLGLIATALSPFILTVTTGLSMALASIAAIATSAVFASVAVVVGIALVITIITAGAFINYSKYQSSVAPIVSECFAPTKTVQVLHNGAVVPDQKAQAGDTLVYTINLNPKSKANEEIKNVVVTDEFAIFLEGSCANPPLPPGTKYELLDVNKLNIYPGSAFQAEGPRPSTTGLNANKPCFREIVWKASSSISSLTRNTEIKYNVQVHGNYPATANFAPAISNLVMVDGEYEITEASGSKRKANCQASISTTVNFSGELVSSMAEKIVKALYECGQRCVDNTNRSQVSACLSQNGIPSAATEEIFRSVSNNGKLQCVGFVQAVEKATGGNLWQVNLASAKDYWRNLAQWGYEQKANTAANRKNLKAGDILIFVDNADGHMAIVVKPVFDPDGNLAKIVIADAKGDTGCVSPYPLDSLSIISPDHPSLVGWQTRR